MVSRLNHTAKVKYFRCDIGGLWRALAFMSKYGSFWQFYLKKKRSKTCKAWKSLITLSAEFFQKWSFESKRGSKNRNKLTTFVGVMCCAQDDRYETEYIYQHVVLNSLRKAHNSLFNSI